MVYCTICSRKKKKILHPIKSIDRYNSARIKKVYNRSVRDGARFRIFSGKFGLIKATKRIPWYDEKLRMENCETMMHILKGQLKKDRIKRIVFFAKNPLKNSSWESYCLVLEKVCKNMKIDFEFRFL